MAIISKGMVINDRFKVDDVIGFGGYGSVWKGEDQQLQRPVAFKRINNASYDPSVRDEIIEEARKISTIVNPHIVAIYDIVEHDDELLIVMEYLPKGTLHEYLRQLSSEGTWVSASESIEILRGILIGLSAAHRSEKGEIIHKDLKPENVLFDSWMRPKIGDFGLASVGKVDRLKTGERTLGHEGTPGYKSPEQLKGEVLDIRSDLYNVGLIAYLLFGAVHPFTDPRNLFDFKEMVLEPYRELPYLKSDSLPPELEEFVFTLLDGDPENRFSSAIGALDELEVVEEKYVDRFIASLFDFHDALKLGRDTQLNVTTSFVSIRAKLERENEIAEIDLTLAVEEIAAGVQICKKNKFYSQGVFLYEHPSLDFSSLREDQRKQLESDYDFCRRQQVREVSSK